MKTLDEYMQLPYKMEIVPDLEEGGYVVSYPDLPGCLTCGETIEKAINNYIASGFNLSAYENELNKLCIKMENYARDIIYSNDGRLKPNSEKVAKKKKGNHPLFDTGQLARSITCRLIR